MSIDISAITEKVFSLDIIEKTVSDFFDCCPRIDVTGKSTYELSGFYKNNDLILYFSESKTTKYWDSIILKKEFGHNQNILFGVSKSPDLDISFNAAMAFFLEIQKRNKCEMLISSSVHDEICYIDKNSKTIWLNHFGYTNGLIKKGDCVADHVTGEKLLTF